MKLSAYLAVWLLLAIAPGASAELLKSKKGACGCLVAPRADHLFEDVRQNCPEVAGAPELLACVPEAMRANYVLVYETGSPQCASPDSPRLVMFSDDGRSMISFPGKHGAPGCDSSSVEFVSFDSKEKRYSPAKMVFDEKGKPHFHTQPSEETGKCTQCHDKDFHPNWASYPMWPGAYGSNHSRIIPGTPEAKSYQAFVAKAARDPLYSQLKPVPSMKPGQPYSTNGEDLLGENNAKLNMAIIRRNSERLVRKMKESPGYDQLKYRLLSGLLSMLKPELKSCQPFDATDLKDIVGSVSEDFRNERMLVNRRLKLQSEPPPKTFKKSGKGYMSREETEYRLHSLPPPEYYPTRAELEADPTKFNELGKDKFIRNTSVLILMARKLGITDTDDFFNRPASSRYDGSRKAFSVDRTGDFDQHLGTFLAQALLADIAKDEAAAPPTSLRASRYPYSSYNNPDRPGLEDELCLRFAADPEKSIALARNSYGSEECRNGIREFPESQGLLQAPSICEKLRRSDEAGPCVADSANPLAEPNQKVVDKGLSAVQNVGNPLVACAGCHDGTHAPIPKFPFGDPKALTYELQNAGSDLKDRVMKQLLGGKMPPGSKAPNDETNKAVQKYLDERLKSSNY